MSTPRFAWFLVRAWMCGLSVHAAWSNADDHRWAMVATWAVVWFALTVWVVGDYVVDRRHGRVGGAS